MASRWRFWNIDFHDETLEKATLKDLMTIRQIRPVGSHTNKLNISPDILRLHTFEEMKPKSSIGRGRGRKAYHDVYIPKPKSEESLRDFAEKMKNSKILNEQEWPSLHQEAVIEEKNKKINKTTTLSNKLESICHTGVKEISERENEISSCSNTPSEDSYHVHVSNYNKEKDFLNQEFLRTLSEPQKYVIIRNLPLEFNDIEFQETILSFGAIDSFKLQVAQDGATMIALVKMENSSHCAWVVSCLDGSSELCEDHRLHVENVSDILGLSDDLDLSF